MYIENRVDDRTRSMLHDWPFNASTHMDNMEKHTADILKINKP